jgi:HSP20 family protein
MFICSPPDWIRTLPDDIDPDQVEARYRDGVLQIHVMRKKASRPRQIEVK